MNEGVARFSDAKEFRDRIETSSEYQTKIMVCLGGGYWGKRADLKSVISGEVPALINKGSYFPDNGGYPLDSYGVKTDSDLICFIDTDRNLECSESGAVKINESNIMKYNICNQLETARIRFYGALRMPEEERPEVMIVYRGTSHPDLAELLKNPTPASVHKSEYPGGDRRSSECYEFSVKSEPACWIDTGTSVCFTEDGFLDMGRAWINSHHINKKK